MKCPPSVPGTYIRTSDGRIFAIRTTGKPKGNEDRRTAASGRVCECSARLAHLLPRPSVWSLLFPGIQSSPHSLPTIFLPFLPLSSQLSLRGCPSHLLHLLVCRLPELFAGIHKQRQTQCLIPTAPQRRGAHSAHIPRQPRDHQRAAAVCGGGGSPGVPAQLPQHHRSTGPPVPHRQCARRSSSRS